VLAVGAGDDGAVGEEVAVPVDDGRPVEGGEAGEGLLVEVRGIDQMVQAPSLTGYLFGPSSGGSIP
jgi:hypothetical protein